MLSCLSLLHLTHVRVEQATDPNRTACGISVVGVVDPGMFAEPPGAATCPACRRAIGAAQLTDAPEPARVVGVGTDPKSVVRRYLDEVLGAAVHAPESGVRVVVDDLIAEGPRVFARYRVVGAGTARSNVQTAIFTVAEQRIAEIEPIVDDFDLMTPLEGTA